MLYHTSVLAVIVNTFVASVDDHNHTQSQIKLNNAPYVVKKLFVGAEAKLCGKCGTE